MRLKNVCKKPVSTVSSVTYLNLVGVRKQNLFIFCYQRRFVKTYQWVIFHQQITIIMHMSKFV